MINSYGQYKNDFFNKLNLHFKKNSTILDVGCGDGSDAHIFSEHYDLKVYGTDVYTHERIMNAPIRFKIGGVFDIPFKQKFDTVFMHDVLHHVDEPKQRQKKHIEALKNIRTTCKKNGTIIIVEGNRYNPLFYPHMVKIHKHDHFTQRYFKSLVTNIFKMDDIQFSYFEAHLYPPAFIWLFKLYEKFMEFQPFKQILAYNVAIISKK